MALQFYGLLTGVITDHQPQAHGNPHYLLFVQARSGTYRVAVNLESSSSDHTTPPELQYQIITDLAANAITQKIHALVAQREFDFVLAQDGAPALDFVRGEILDMSQFKTLPAGIDPENNDYRNALVDAATQAQQANQDGETFVAVFGTGYSDHGSGRGSQGGTNLRRASFGFTGVDNIHMNQGSFLEVGNRESQKHYRENGPNQDGAVLFFFADGSVRGFFSKFQSQDTETTARGLPVHSGVQELDEVTPRARERFAAARPQLEEARAAQAEAARADPIAAPPQAALAEAAASTAIGPKAASGFVFADPAPGDLPDVPFRPDDDKGTQKTPTYLYFTTHPEPIPGPRGGVNPVMKLEDILDAQAIGQIRTSRQIQFHSVGDTGAPKAVKLPNEMSVTELMTQDFTAPASPPNTPSFIFHLGDVVYYYGEREYYYDQFFKPYQDYPAPIFAIPGNHDGMTYSPDMQTLDAFQEVFCAAQPGRLSGIAGGIYRSAMTQPGVYFTLDAPFVSIIGLYSNVDEHYGWINEPQKVFLHNELGRLQDKRNSGEISAVILAVHHPPLSFSRDKPGSPSMLDDIDEACKAAGLWPDAVLSGHAHVYQRMTRTLQVEGNTREFPYIVCGAGGYDANPKQEIDKASVAELDQTDPENRLHRFLANYGYLNLTVVPGDGQRAGTLRIEFRSPQLNGGRPADVCLLNLATHRLLQ